MRQLELFEPTELQYSGDTAPPTEPTREEMIRRVTEIAHRATPERLRKLYEAAIGRC